jgi:hypothetical protein
MKTALLLLATFCSYAGLCQSGKLFTVISTSGLNLRDKPSLQSKVIKALPWGTRVQVTEVVNKEKVSLGIQHIADRNEDGSVDTIFLTGRWVKANQGGLIGYLFDAFLLETDSRPQKKLPDYALLFESYNCFYNLDFDPGWNWYGLYESEGRPIFKQTSVSCIKYAEDELDLGDFLVIHTKESTEARFVVGCKTQLNTNKFRQYEGEYPLSLYSTNSFDEAQRLVRQVGLDLALVKRTNSDNQTFERNLIYALGQNGQKQSLELADDNQGEWTLSELTWAGDLDGDGKNDYIVYYGEVSAVTILYLSSIASKEQVVKEAARWYSGYCC